MYGVFTIICLHLITVYNSYGKCRLKPYIECLGIEFVMVLGFFSKQSCSRPSWNVFFFVRGRGISRLKPCQSTLHHLKAWEKRVVVVCFVFSLFFVLCCLFFVLCSLFFVFFLFVVVVVVVVVVVRGVLRDSNRLSFFPLPFRFRMVVLYILGVPPFPGCQDFYLNFDLPLFSGKGGYTQQMIIISHFSIW